MELTAHKRRGPRLDFFSPQRIKGRENRPKRSLGSALLIKPMSKKAFELQFHWIFIMIAGALILAFFFTIAQKQRSISEDKLALTLASDIENIFIGAIASKGTAQGLPVPPQGIDFECKEGCNCFFSIEGKPRSFGDKVMFAPGSIEGARMVVWAEEWKQPYRVTNFLFVSDPGAKYYFVYNPSNSQSSQWLDQLTKRIPKIGQSSVIDYENITSEALPGIQNEGFDNAVFVLLNVPPADLDPSFKRTEVRAVQAVAGTSPHLKFFYNDGTKLEHDETWPLIDLTAIYAAMFSDSARMYECGMKNAFKKMSYISELYIKRSDMLGNNAVQAGKVWCSYQNGIDRLTEQVIISSALSNRLDAAKIVLLNPIAYDLDQINRELTTKWSCPEMF